MDQAMFALDGMEDIKPGEPVVLMGKMGEEAISPMDWARWQSTIPYEVLTSLTARLPRVYIDSTEKPGRALVCKSLY
jgi:alanine racemase